MSSRKQASSSEAPHATGARFDARELLASLPNRPGVYRMIDAAGETLYVGKARDLKKRVSSYFQKTDHHPRTAMMITQIARVDTTVSRSEGEALLLENNLIKAHQPRYNVLFRDDKSYPYVCLTGEPFPQLRFHRGKLEKPHRYFGPFPSAGAVREGMTVLQKVFLLRTCEASVFANRSRPCMLYQIQRCTGPCVGLISEADYQEDVRNATLFLQGKTGEVLAGLQRQMDEAAATLAFERAARLRDKITRLQQLQSRQFVESATAGDIDVVAGFAERGLTAVNVVMIRGGRHVGDKTYFPQHADGATLDEVVAAFLLQHYLERTVPPIIIATELAPVVGDGVGGTPTGIDGPAFPPTTEPTMAEPSTLQGEPTIVVEAAAPSRLPGEAATDTAPPTVPTDAATDNALPPTRADAAMNSAPSAMSADPAIDIVLADVLADVLSAQSGHRVQLITNPGGERRVWVTMAVQNADFAIRQKLAQKATQDDRLAALQEALGLPPSVQRIECFDVSHTMGESAVASCVVFDRLSMQTGEYRRFNVKPPVGGDDYAAMREALTRRVARIVSGEYPPPDLLVIDGGRGQVGVAAEVLAEQGMHGTQLIGIAKGPERKPGEEEIIFPGREKALQLSPDNPGLHLLQQIRDEAHRFAIQGHRARRAKTRNTSTLESIAGIGARKRQALLAHFGGLKGVQAASADDLARVPGISRALADRIFIELH